MNNRKVISSTIPDYALTTPSGFVFNSNKLTLKDYKRALSIGVDIMLDTNLLTKESIAYKALPDDGQEEKQMARISSEAVELMNNKLDKQIALTNSKDEDAIRSANFILEGFTSSQLEMVKDFIESFS
jgi:hypothetical protein